LRCVPPTLKIAVVGSVTPNGCSIWNRLSVLANWPKSTLAPSSTCLDFAGAKVWPEFCVPAGAVGPCCNPSI
jgi:hypothetical protein